VANAFQIGYRVTGKRQWRLVFFDLDVGAKLLTRAGDSEAFFVKKSLDAEHGFEVLTAVHALPGAAFNRLQLRKFGFPEAKNVGGKAAELRDFADAEVEFVWNDDFVAAGGLGFCPCRAHVEFAISAEKALSRF